MSRPVAYLQYFARTSFGGLRASPVTTSVCVITIAVVLVLIGVFQLLLGNMEGLLDRFGDELRITAYLEAGLPEADRRALAKLVTTVEGVDMVLAVSEDEALARFRESVGAHSGLLDALDENPLPASLEITLTESQRSPDGLRVVVEAIDGLPGITDLAYGQEWVEGYARTLALVRGLGIALGCVLGLAALLIVANTIRLAVYARRDELEILTLVGAGRVFRATPFLAEGLVQGVAGGLVALAVLYAFFRLLMPGLEHGLVLLTGFAAPHFLVTRDAVTLVSTGALLGLMGSLFALVQGGQE